MLPDDSRLFPDMIIIFGTLVWCFFHFFKIFRVVSGLKGQKWPKMTKSFVCHALYLWNHTSYDCHLRSTCVKNDISGVFFLGCFCFCFLFFNFIKFWFSTMSWAGGGGREGRGFIVQKKTQNNKKSYSLCLAS